MADFALNIDSRPIAVSAWVDGTYVSAAEVAGAQVWSIQRGYPKVTYYKMRGMDAIVSGLYDAWLAVGTPDLTGAVYTGTLAKPLRDIIVVDTWSL